MALLALIVAGTAFLLVQKLNAASTQVDREAQTRKALLQAKQALLAFAALDDTAGSNMNRPGSLPCPAEALATTARKDWGTALGSCGAPTPTSTTITRVGRLPWKTLGLPELTDGNGEHLWYALSPRFRDLGEINADMRGQIELCRVASKPCPAGESVASEVVAVIFAPGAPVTTSGGYLQDRRTAASRDEVVNYLEGFFLDSVASSLDQAVDQFRAGPVAERFNDRLVTITQADLLEATENAVAARLRTLILPRLRRYYADWGAFPYAAPFNPTDTVLDAKLAPTTQGMLPLAMGAATMSLGWKALLYEVKQGPTTVGTCTAASATDELVCDMPAPVSGAVTLSVEIADVGFGLVEPMQAGVASPAAAVSTQAFAATLQANGTATVVASWSVNSPTTDIQVRLALPQKSALSGFTYDWLVLNRWYQQILYAIPPNLAPGGSLTCATTATTNCLTIQRRDDTTAAASLALVLAGRPVLRESPPAGCAVQIRPAWPPMWVTSWDQNPAPGCAEALTAATYLPNYFEGVNNDAVTTLPVTFKEGYRSPTFNDRVVWLTAYDAGATPRMECAPWKC
ncbi:MAG: hypothetical protein MUC55_00205 [Burkholderiales bacterium]|nr:hypothetical protein [Burkholderiales bacterium]